MLHFGGFLNKPEPGKIIKGITSADIFRFIAVFHTNMTEQTSQNSAVDRLLWRSILVDRQTQFAGCLTYLIMNVLPFAQS